MEKLKLNCSSVCSILLLTALLLSSWGLLEAQNATAPEIGNGTEENPYQIATLENLYWITASENVVPDPNREERWRSHYIQTININASETRDWFDGSGWDPIGFDATNSFAGSYNGQNHVIDSLYISRLESDRVGMFGYITDAKIENIGVVNADITGRIMVGALAGSVWKATINNCYSTGSVSGRRRTGGLVGIAGHLTFDNNYSSCSVSGMEDVGGLVGLASDCAISNSYSTGNLTGEWSVSGLVGFPVGSTFNNSHYNYEQMLINDESVITIGALNDEMFNAWLNSDLFLDIDNYLTHNGDRYLINSVDDFSKLIAFGQYKEYSYKLTDNLNLADHPDFYIPYFSGEFEGNGHVVDNLTITMNSFSYIGLFGYIESAVIENLSVTNVDIAGDACVGSLVGGAGYNSLISNSYSTGDVKGYWSVGGLVGNVVTSKIRDNHSTANVKGRKWRTGGLVGSAIQSHISNSYSTGSVAGLESCVGGLVGNVVESTIIKSYSTGNVVGQSRVGGLAGHLSESTISKSFSTGNVAGDYYVGGLVAAAWNDSAIDNSYSSGSVTGVWSIGGLVGHAKKSGISNSYSIGSVTGDQDVGGLIGIDIDSGIIDSYWNLNTSGMDTSAGGMGRTTDGMTYPYSANTFVNWNFNEIWKPDEDYSVNNGYPYLQEDEVSVKDDIVVEAPFIPLLTNYPNPFNPETVIKFKIKEETDATLSIYNVRGQLVNTLHKGSIRAGEHNLIWNGKDDNGRDVGSGVYFYRLKTDYYDQVNKMLLAK